MAQVFHITRGTALFMNIYENDDPTVTKIYWRALPCGVCLTIMRTFLLISTAVTMFAPSPVVIRQSDGAVSMAAHIHESYGTHVRG